MPDDHRTRLLTAIRNSSTLLDDDQLSRRTGIEPRQTVNQVLRRLEHEGLVRRYTGLDGKIVTEVTASAPSPTGPAAASAATNVGRIGTPVEPEIELTTGHAIPPGNSAEQRDAERVMLDLLGERLGQVLEPATIKLGSGARVEIDGADAGRTVLVECWAHQGPPKGGQKHKVMTDALKLTWIASTLYPRPQLILCMSDPLAAGPFLPASRSWGAQALQDLGIRIELVDLPNEVRDAVIAAQARQHR